jgi:hypothetical protein
VNTKFDNGYLLLVKVLVLLESVDLLSVLCHGIGSFVLCHVEVRIMLAQRIFVDLIINLKIA